MWKFELIQNINKVLLESSICKEGDNYHDLFCYEGDAECRIKNYCTYTESSLAEILIDCLTDIIQHNTLENITAYTIGQMITEIIDFVTCRINLSGYPVTIFDCINPLCDVCIFVQQKPVSMNASYSSKTKIHHVQPQITQVDDELDTCFYEDDNNDFILTNRLFFMFGTDRFVNGINVWSKRIQNRKGTFVADLSIQRKNIFNKYLKHYDILFDDFIGPVCSYQCFLIFLEQKIKKNNFVLTKNYKLEIVESYIKMAYGYFPLVLTKLISKYFSLFDMKVDAELFHSQNKNFNFYIRNTF